MLGGDKVLYHWSIVDARPRVKDMTPEILNRLGYNPMSHTIRFCDNKVLLKSEHSLWRFVGKTLDMVVISVKDQLLEFLINHHEKFNSGDDAFLLSSAIARFERWCDDVGIHSSVYENEKRIETFLDLFEETDELYDPANALYLLKIFEARLKFDLLSKKILEKNSLLEWLRLMEDISRAKQEMMKMVSDYRRKAPKG